MGAPHSQIAKLYVRHHVLVRQRAASPVPCNVRLSRHCKMKVSSLAGVRGLTDYAMVFITAAERQCVAFSVAPSCSKAGSGTSIRVVASKYVKPLRCIQCHHRTAAGVCLVSRANLTLTLRSEETGNTRRAARRSPKTARNPGDTDAPSYDTCSHRGPKCTTSPLVRPGSKRQRVCQ